MKLLFLSTVFPDDDDPSRGTYNSELCRALAVEHHVSVVSPRSWTEVIPRALKGKTYSAANGLSDSRIEAAYPTYWYPPRFGRGQYGEFLWKSSATAVRELCRTHSPDAVLSYWAHPDGEAGLRAAREYGVPAAVIVGGSDVLLLPNCPKRGERVRRVLNESDAVITVSDGLRNKVIELGIDAASVHTITQGINTELFHANGRKESRIRVADEYTSLASDRPVLLWVGRMVEVKRLDVLIETAALLQARGRDFTLALVGDGPERSKVEALASERRLQDRVLFTGAVAPDSLGVWYRAANVTVLSSESEGLPNVLRESLACGTPFVSTRVGSIAEIADERYSVLVLPQSPDALAEGIEDVLDGAHRQNAMEYQPRTWSEMADDVVRLFRECGATDASSEATEQVSCHVS
ncbi:MAG: glycosyltransferase [Planctomycetaceae bacterium]|nr:glycosyltransferase [Planctomycetaceae bacterium]